ncbi:MAG: hypothetical protein KAT62_01455 [Desulfuromonadales bacterium]|nr:hypothetical protein [Desulfuromonadales bacterium]
MEQNMKSQDESLSREVSGAYQADEVDLVQLWLILSKRKYLIGGICSLCLLGGVAFAFLVPDKYTYSTSIEIGTTLENNGSGIVSRTIESPEAALAKIKESYIPLAVAQMTEQSTEKSFAIQARIPKKSNLIILSSKDTVNMAESYRVLHGLVTKPLMEDHLRIIDVPRRQYRISSDQAKIKLKILEDPRIFAIEEKDLLIQTEAAKMQLTGLDDQKNLLLSQDKRLTETQVLLRQQINTVEENLAQVHASRPKATAEVGNEAQAMTLLMINNQIEQNEKRLSGLQERLTIGLENQKEILQKKVAENRRAWKLQKEKIFKLQSQLVKLKVQRELDQESQENVISSIENKLTDLQETHTLGVAVRSFKPAGSGKKIVLALSGMLGLMGGVMLAFFAEFVSTARQRMVKEG